MASSNAPPPDDGPFRKLAVTRWSRPRGRFEPPAAAIGLLGLLVAAAIVPLYGVAVGCAMIPVIAIVASLPAGARYQRARRRIAALPFPVRHGHRRPDMADGFSLDRVGIVAVEIAVSHELAPEVRDAIASDAERRVPGLSVTIHADRGLIQLDRWAWGGEDLSALAELLATWGRELHDRATIRHVDVLWRAGAPV